MSTPLEGFDTRTFVAQYWQRKPCLIRQAFPGFEPPLDGDDLAGLACEEMSEARIVSGHYPDHNWAIQHGPFDESIFSSLPETGWTLLVQDVEKHYPPLQTLMQEFHFLPSWRLDDLMISYAVEGGSVGPHVDQYDVFLLQTQGRRRWQIAPVFDPREVPDCELKVLQSFTAQSEWVLEPGDMLYLPPGVAHHGVALEPGMTWSIGFRAPSAADLLQGLGEFLSFQPDQGGRYCDPGVINKSLPGEIDKEAQEGLRRLLITSLADEPRLQDFLGAFISRFRLANQVAPPPVQVTADELVNTLSLGAELVRHPWTRINWIRQGPGARLFAAGDSYDCSIGAACWLSSLPSARPLDLPLDAQLTSLLTALVNTGHLLLSEIEPQG
jgi:50S ribosomal protein L16 3-hydroxylase